MKNEKNLRSVDKELADQILELNDAISIANTTDPEYKVLADRQVRLLAMDMMRRKDKTARLQVYFAAIVPVLLILVGWGARVLVQSPFWKDWVKFVSDLMRLRIR